ncbi:MAG: hypothetical protein K0R57_2428 [Paenibacillaceae bacterium]|nr:hypothetical protein [Paenibacillaceae bacterium]
MSVLELNNGSIAGPKPLVIVCHGWTGHKESMVGVATRLANIGCFALSIDARNHGMLKQREGYPPLLESIIETVSEMDNLIDKYSEHPLVDPDRIGLLGVSMGGAVFLKYLTRTRRPIRAVVSAVTSSIWSEIYNEEMNEKLKQISTDFDKMAALARDEQPINEWSAIPNMPLLLLAGDEDPLIPLEHVERLHSLFRERDGNLSRVKMNVYPGVMHDYTKEMMDDSIEWMKFHLFQ